MDKKIRCVYRANLINRHSVREKEGRHDIWHDFSIPFLPSEHSGARNVKVDLFPYRSGNECIWRSKISWSTFSLPIFLFLSTIVTKVSNFQSLFFPYPLSPSPFLENRRAAPRSWKKQIESEGWRMGGRTLTMKFLFVRWSKFVRHVLKRKAIPPFKSF